MLLVMLCLGATQGDFELLVRAAAERSLAEGLVLVSVSALPQAPPTKAPLEITVTPLTRRLLGRVPAKVDVTGRKTRLAFQIVLTIESERRVVRLARALRLGEIVGAGDLQVSHERSQDDPLRDAVTDPAAAIGQRARTNLNAGAALLVRDLERVPIVFSKGQVRLTVRSGALFASAPGEAQQAGAEGDMIRVINLLSSKVVMARVVDATSVEVQP